MRWLMRITAVAILTATLTTAGFAQKGGLKDAIGETCNGDHGTNVHFEKTPKDAAARAEKEQKLVMVLHISGLFEDPDFT